MRTQTPQKDELFARALRTVVLGVFAVFVCTVLAAVVSLLIPSRTSAATANNVINFQARLQTAGGAIVPDGNYNVSFHLFSSVTPNGTENDTACGTDTNCEWTEVWGYNTGAGASDVRLRVTNGYLTVSLGANTAFPTTINWDQQQWLTMDIGGTSGSSFTWDSQMSPRIQLTAAPYALSAQQLSYTNGSGNRVSLQFTSPTQASESITAPDPHTNLGSNSATLCFQTDTNCGFATGSGTAFLQGGNNFTGTVAGNLGTTNNGVLNFLTNNTNKLQLDTSGNLLFQQASTEDVVNNAAGAGFQLTIQGGASSSGTSTGGNLLLQGGAGSSTGVSGSVIVKPAGHDTTTAFQVQNAAGTSNVLTVDTTDSQVQLKNLNDGAVVGSEQFLASNSQTFTNGSNWAVTNNTYGQTVTAVHTPGSSLVLPASPNLLGVAGTTYQITYTVTLMSAGSVQARIGGSTGESVSTNMTQVDILTAASAGNFQFVPTSGFDGTISLVSVIPITTQTAVLNSSDSTGSLANELRVSTLANGNLGLGYNDLEANTGTFNTAIGTHALANITTGASNTSVGYNALQYQTTGSFNVALGTRALQNDNNGASNVALGYQAMQNAYTSASSVAVGANALTNLTTGNQNTGIGWNSLKNITNGGTNTAVGFASGDLSTSGDFFELNSVNNATTIGERSLATCSNCVILGGQGSNDSVSYGLGTPNPTNFFSAQPPVQDTGTVSTYSTTTVDTLSTGSFNANEIGDEIYIASNSSTTATYKGTIQTVPTSTSLTVSPAVGFSGTTLHYYILYAGLQVKSNGNVGIQNLSPSYPLDVTGDINTSTQYRIGGTIICSTSGSTGCTPQSGSGFYIQNQTAAQQSSSNFWISGSGRADTSLSSPSLDVAVAGALTIGSSLASSVGIGNTTAATTVTIQGGTGASAVSITSGSGGTINIGAANQAQTIQIGSGTFSTAATQSINIGNNNTSGGTTNISIGTGASATAGATTVQAKGVLTLTGTGGITASGAAASSLTTSSGALTLTSAATAVWSTSGGTLTIQGATGATVQSAAGATSSAVSLTSGAASSGVSGTIGIDNGTFTSGTPTINIGTANARTIQIGQTAASAITQTIAIGNGGSTSTTNLTLGNTNAGTTTIQGGTSITLNNNTSLAANQNFTYTAGSGNFDQHNSTGTFQTGTGTVSLNGATTVATAKNFTVTAGATSLTGLAAGSSTAAAIVTGAASNVGLNIQAVSAQTANLFQIQDSTVANLLAVSAGGNVEQLGYHDTPYGGFGPYGNLIVQSENFSTTWVITNVTVTGNSTVAPDGNTTADTLADAVSSVSASQASTTAITATATAYTFSVWLKTSSSTQAFALRIDGSSGGTGTAFTGTATTTWQRFSVTQTVSTGAGFSGNVKVLLFPGGTGGSGTVIAWGAQLNLGSTPQIYTTTGTGTNFASDGSVVNGSLLIVPASTNTNTLQIQNGTTTDVLDVDTTNGRVGINSNGPGNTFVVQGGSTLAGAQDMVLLGSNYDPGNNGFVRAAEALDTGLTTQASGENIVFDAGTALSTDNAAYFGEHYTGTGADNSLTFGLFGADNLMNLYPNGDLQLGGTVGTPPSDNLQIAATTSSPSIYFGSGGGSKINMSGSATSSTVYNFYGSSSESIINEPSSGGDIAFKNLNTTIAYMNSSGQLALGGTGTPGATLDLGSSGTIQGAGLSADCSGTYNRLLWSSSTKQFSCGTTRASYQFNLNSNQTFSSTTLANATNMDLPVGASETWIFYMNVGVSQSTGTDDYKFNLTVPAGATCNYSTFANNKSTVSSDGKDTCSGTGIQWGNSNQAAGDDFLLNGVITNSTTAGNVQLQIADWTAGGTVTLFGPPSFVIGYKVSGADLAEIYYTDDSAMGAGDVVAIDPSKPASVTKTTTSYQTSAVGVISTQPGQILGAADGSGIPQPLALAGRVPVKVSSINGAIEAGDYLTPSSIPGVAMKATHAGQMIGKAMTPYSNSDPNAIGMTIAFVDNTWADPGYDSSAAGMLQSQDSVAVTNLSDSVNTLKATTDGLVSQIDRLNSHAAMLDQPDVFLGNSDNQLQIQNSQGDMLFNADTKNMIVTVKNLVVSGTLTVDGHIVTGGSVPTITAGSAACNNPTVSVNGDDEAGTLSILTGSSCHGAGPLATVTFATPYSLSPHVQITPNSADSAQLIPYKTSTPTDFTIDSANVPANSTSYSYDYLVTQ